MTAPLALLLALTLPARAVPPGPGISRAGPQISTTCVVNPYVLQRRAYNPSAPALAAPATYQVLVALVEFDFTGGTTAQFTLSPGALQTQLNKVRQYVLETTYGRVAPTFTLTSVMHIGQPKTDFSGSDCTDPGSPCTGVNNLVADVILDSNGPIYLANNFTLYDQILILTAGEGAETTPASADRLNNFWSQFYVVSDPDPNTPCVDGQGHPTGFAVQGKCFDGVSFVPEKEAAGADSLGVIAHEYMHLLGAVDLYDTSIDSSVAGNWSLMDNGLYGGSPAGSNPAHLDAWHKVYLGYASPTTPPFGSSAVFFPSAEKNSGLFKLPSANGDVGALEYFLLEYRNKTGTSGAVYDASLPASGLLAWHIDESRGTLALNNVELTLRPRVRLMRASANGGANPNQPLPANGTGDAGDPYPGTGSVSTFAARDWNGKDPLAGAASLLGAGASAMSGFLQRPLPVASAQVTTIVFQNAVLQVPAGALSANVDLLLSTPTAFPAAVSAVGPVVPTGVGVDIAADRTVVVNKPLSLTLSYLPAQVAGRDTSRLILARYDPGSGLWIPLPSSSDPIQRTVTAPLTHLSLFEVMEFTPAAVLDRAKAFPNPVSSSQGQHMTFANLPAGASITLYTLTGQVLRTITAGVTGLADWDAQNSAGQPAASGVYFALVDDGNGNRKILKVMVER